MDGWISMHNLKILRQKSQVLLLKERDKKVYKCEICDQEFNNENHLQKHYNYHPKKATRKSKIMEERHKDHKCESCDKSFSHAQNLKKHIHTVHEGLSLIHI